MAEFRLMSLAEYLFDMAMCSISKVVEVDWIKEVSVALMVPLKNGSTKPRKVSTRP